MSAGNDARSQRKPRQSGSSNSAPIDPVAKLDRIYDLRRDCLLNELYYGHRLSLFSRLNLWLDAVIVIGSGASGVSGWVIWTTYPELKVVWAVIAATATLLAALKPVLHIDTQVKRYSILFASYRQLSLSMVGIVQEIAEARGVSVELEREINRVRTRYISKAAEDDPKPSGKLIRRLQSEVNDRVPVDMMFYPLGTNTSEDPVNQNVTTEGVGVGLIEPWPHVGGRTASHENFPSPYPSNDSDLCGARLHCLRSNDY